MSGVAKSRVACAVRYSQENIEDRNVKSAFKISAFKILAVLAIISLGSSVMAADSTTKPSKKVPSIRGKVEKVDGTKITVTTRDGEKVIDTDDNTKFTLDGQPATLADVKADERVLATPDTGVAEAVKITTGNKKRKDKDPAKEPTTAPAGNTTVAPN